MIRARELTSRDTVDYGQDDTHICWEHPTWGQVRPWRFQRTIISGGGTVTYEHRLMFLRPDGSIDDVAWVDVPEGVQELLLADLEG